NRVGPRPPTNNAGLSRSSSYSLVCGAWRLAVTRQSMLRMSSPGWYCRTSENVIPRPFCRDWRSPAWRDRTGFTDGSFRARASACRRTSSGRVMNVAGLESAMTLLWSPVSNTSGGNRNPVDQPLQHGIGGHAFGLGFKGQQNPVSQHIVIHGLDVVRCHVIPAIEPRQRPGATIQGNGAAGAGAE